MWFLHRLIEMWILEKELTLAFLNTWWLDMESVRRAIYLGRVGLFSKKRSIAVGSRRDGDLLSSCLNCQLVLLPSFALFSCAFSLLCPSSPKLLVLQSSSFSKARHFLILYYYQVFIVPGIDHEYYEGLERGIIILDSSGLFSCEYRGKVIVSRIIRPITSIADKDQPIRKHWQLGKYSLKYSLK